MKRIINEMKLRLPARSINESVCRAIISAFSAELNPTVEELGDLRCAVSEAVTNCIVHAYRDLPDSEEGYIYISARLYDCREITVEISDKLINKRGTPDANVEIHITDMMGWKNSGKVRVTLCDQYNNYITSFTTKGGSTIKLGDDHRVYHIYIDTYNEPLSKNWFWRIINMGNNFENDGKTVNWKITNAKNGTIR